MVPDCKQEVRSLASILSMYTSTTLLLFILLMLTSLSRTTPFKVENVSRFLRYMQPEGEQINLDLLTKSTETRQFLTDLRRTKMKHATILNYIKNIIRFLEFLNVRLDLNEQDPSLQMKITAFRDFLCTLRKPVSKAHSRDVSSTR